ncbi:hypothetical protein [Streptomyces nigrescens]|nr:hypothetical protein [Streptomyces nigrescens]
MAGQLTAHQARPAFEDAGRAALLTVHLSAPPMARAAVPSGY